MYLPKYYKKLVDTDTYEYLRKKKAEEKYREYIAKVGFYSVPLPFIDWLDIID